MTDDARRLTALQEKVDQLEQALVDQRNVNAAAQMATLLSLTAVSQTLRHSYGIQQEMLTGLGYRYKELWPFGNLPDTEAAREQYSTLINTLITDTKGEFYPRPEKGV